MDEQVRISKTLSLWLRHDPAAGGITLDPEGWAEVPVALTALSRTLTRTITPNELEAVVAGSSVPVANLAVQTG